MPTAFAIILSFLPFYYPSPEEVARQTAYITLQRFPPRDVCYAAGTLNYTFQRYATDYFAARGEWRDAWNCHEILAENERRASVYWHIVSAWNDLPTWPEYAWQELNDLHTEVGDEAFYTGHLPPPVPLEWFAQLN